MTERDDRRFTDQEVALVLRRAAELEEKNNESAATRGLTRGELQDLAREVGFSPEIVSQALTELGQRSSIKTWRPLGPVASAKSAAAARGSLSRDELQELVRIMEDNANTPGTVTEALGTIRWTSVSEGNRLSRVTQVSIRPGKDETDVQVRVRYPERLRAILQLMPASWGLIIAGGLMDASGAGVLAIIATMLGSTLLGGLLGRGIWSAMARRNEKDTRELAQDLADIATEIGRRSKQAPTEGGNA